MSRKVMQQALEALERCVATCFDQYAHEQVMSRPEHFVNQNITALRAALAEPEQEPLPDKVLRGFFILTNTAEPLAEGWPGLERFARAIERAHGIKEQEHE